MNLLILGPPGAGKGTQSKLISKEYNIPHISSGDLFRQMIRSKSKMGLLLKQYIEKGKYVPDDVTIQLFLDRLSQKDCNKGFLLDGFPRTISQAEALSDFLSKSNKSISCALKIDIDSYLIVKRLAGRRVCPKCESTYHVQYNPPKQSGICDTCLTKLIIRVDDNPETAIKRLEVYLQATYPLMEFYYDRNLLIPVLGVGSLEKVFARFKKVLSNYDNN